MQYPYPLVQATLIRRYKRFLADVRFADGTERTVHCANPGSMRGLANEGARCAVLDTGNPRRKLPWSLELVEVDGTWVAVNTSRTNALVAEALAAGALAPLRGTATVSAEVTCGDSRIDFGLDDALGRRWVEVKQVTLVDGSVARFPDSRTTRGVKHVDELTDRVTIHGERATLLLVATRADVDCFRPAADIDPDWAAALRRAIRAGVDVQAWRCDVSMDSIEITSPLPVEPGE
jgi:sugar fermentation stimulation protein A